MLFLGVLALATGPTSLAIAAEDPPAAVSDAVVLVRTADSTGTAFSLGNDLYVTAHHVVVGQGWVRLSFGMLSTGAQVVAVDPADDVAVLRSVIDLAPATLALGEEVHVGDPVRAIGHPAGGPLTVRPGTVQVAPGRTIDASPISQRGMSGGPLLDAGGRVVGVLIATTSTAPTVAVPSSRVLDALAEARITPPAVPRTGAAMWPVWAVSSSLLGVLTFRLHRHLRAASDPPVSSAGFERAGHLSDEVQINLGPVRRPGTSPLQDAAPQQITRPSTAAAEEEPCQPSMS